MHHDTITKYSALMKAAAAKGLTEEERRCQRIDDVSRHSITELKPVDEQKDIYRTRIQEFEEDLSTAESVFQKVKANS